VFGSVAICARSPLVLGAFALLAALFLLIAVPRAGASVPPPRVEARAWTVVDANTGDVLLSHAAARRLPIASTTKLMTAYVVLHELPLDRVVRARRYLSEYGESLLGLRVGQRISVRDLLYGLILRSGNDAAYDLALAAAGSEPAFVRQMNRYAAALGLTDTHYANPIGLDQRGNYSSARDLATLTRRLLAIPAFARIAAARSAMLRSIEPPRRIETINELLEMAPWVTGVKTGHTFGARYVLVGSGRRKGVELVAVAIGAPTDEDRFRDDLDLLRYGFTRYRRRVPVRRGQALAEPSIRYAVGGLPLRASRTVAVGLRRGQRLRVAVEAPSDVEGPIERGARLGSATVYAGERRVARVALRAGRAVPKASRLEVVRSYLTANVAWLALALSAILIFGAIVFRRRTR
jgi:serine-type D-Ala-D-Ala carboxypeptidase (penicillin-binding protein 5/6)